MTIRTINRLNNVYIKQLSLSIGINKWKVLQLV